MHVTDRGYPKPGFRVFGSAVEKCFFAAPSSARRHPLHFEKSSNMAKNIGKPCSSCLQPIFRLISSTAEYISNEFAIPEPGIWTWEAL